MNEEDQGDVGVPFWRGPLLCRLAHLLLMSLFTDSVGPTEAQRQTNTHQRLTLN